MAQTQFIDSLLPGNPVLIAVTLYLDYLLFRYFQYAFHLGDFFDLAQKYGRDSCYAICAGPDAFIPVPPNDPRGSRPTDSATLHLGLRRRAEARENATGVLRRRGSGKGDFVIRLYTRL